jgi:hypothetical protein
MSGPDRASTSPAAAPTETMVDRAAKLRRVLGHEWTVAALAAVFLSLLLTRGALADPAHTLPQDIWDPSLVSYLIAWDGYALLHNPAGIWHLNAFYPASYGLAYTDSMLGYAPFAILGTGPEAAVLRYNLLYILALALVLFGGYALARQLGLGRTGSALVGVALAVAPWRLAQAGHLQILSTGGMFLALAMLARGHGVRWHRPGSASGERSEPARERGSNATLPVSASGERGSDATWDGGDQSVHRPGWVIAGWLVATWQLTIGFGVGLPFIYVLLACMIGGIAIWTYRRRPMPGWRLLAADGAGGLVFATAAVLLAQPYLKVLELYPYTRRDAAWVALYSPPVSGWFTAPAESLVWGEAHATSRAAMSIPGEMALLPGFMLYAVAAAGLVFSVWPLLVRLALASGAVAFMIFSLGTEGPADGHAGYLMLLNLPGFEGIRTPGRLMLWATLLLALLAGGAVCALGALVREIASFRGLARPTPMARAAVVLPVLLVLLEGLGSTPHVRVPQAPPTLSTVAAPYLVLPTHQLWDMHVMLWSTDRFAETVNGGSGVVPTEQDKIRRAAATFPDANSVAYLRGVGVLTVVVLPDRAYGTPLQNAATMPIDGLGITREVHPDAVVFQLSP